MTNLNLEFIMFYHQISLSASQKKITRGLRQSLRNKIKLYFKDNPPSCIKKMANSLETLMNIAS
jgi:hypothetical protein